MIEKSCELQQLESWLAMLICTYRKHPSEGLAKVIHYYIQRVTSFENEYAHCAVDHHYQSLQKYWQWLSQ